MPDPREILRLLADPTRLRLLALLEREELAVAELQEILGMGQSRISSHLALLRQGGLVNDRKEGKRSFYSLSADTGGLGTLVESALRSLRDDPEIQQDRQHLERILERRRHQAEAYFEAVAGRLGKHYCPGRSWEAIGHFLLRLTPSIDIADLGAGEGQLAQLLARRAHHVYCIDNSPKMVEVGTQLARDNGIDNLEYRLGDIEDVPLPEASVDLAFLSQALHHADNPPRALQEAFRILRPQGQLIILDLKEHSFEKAHELYADRWLGFPPNRLYQWLRDTGFQKVTVETVAREMQDPGFETLLACGLKSGS